MVSDGGKVGRCQFLVVSSQLKAVVTVGSGIQPSVALLAWTWAFGPGCDGDAPLALRAGRLDW